MLPIQQSLQMNTHEIEKAALTKFISEPAASVHPLTCGFISAHPSSTISPWTYRKDNKESFRSSFNLKKSLVLCVIPEYRMLKYSQRHNSKKSILDPISE